MRQVTHALLTRPPLGILKSIRKLQSKYLVRLACVRHAASVHPEPGSNSHVISFYLYEVLHEYYVKAQFEAEGFELPRWVVQVQNLAWLIFKPFYCFVRFCSECSHSWSKPKTIFIRIFRVLHTVQFSRNFVSLSLSFSAATRLFYHTVSGLSRTF